jgi:ABC-type lipopolysaccharide export system ATPase subunit
LADEFILETHGLTKEFAGFIAVRDVGLRIRRGSIHALIGPNGAGKTTCFNLLTKFLKPSAGQIRYNGRDITALAPADVARLGLVRSFQISAVFPHLTALENVRVALQRQHGYSFDFWRSKSVLDRFNNRAHELLDDVGLSEFAKTPAIEMPYGRKRALEIATTLALDPEMMSSSRGHRQDRRAHQTHFGEIHDPDGRAQSERGCQPVRYHHRADTRTGARRGQLCRPDQGRARQGSLSGSRSWLTGR